MHFVIRYVYAGGEFFKLFLKNLNFGPDLQTVRSKRRCFSDDRGIRWRGKGSFASNFTSRTEKVCTNFVSERQRETFEIRFEISTVGRRKNLRLERAFEGIHERSLITSVGISVDRHVVSSIDDPSVLPPYDIIHYGPLFLFFWSNKSWVRPQKPPNSPESEFFFCCM
mgnify:CR=1 FL=1